MAGEPGPIATTRTLLAPTELDVLLRVSRALSRTIALDPLLDAIARGLCSVIPVERASIFLHDAGRRELWTRVALDAPQIRMRDDAGLAGAALTSNAPIVSESPYDDPRFNREIDARTGFVTRNILSMPMMDLDGRAVGVLQAINKDEPFDAHDLAMCQMFADQAGVAVQRWGLHEAAVERAELRREMELAREMQRAVLPTASPSVPGLEVAGWMQPASITGGDGYDFWRLADGRLALFLGDASGHGVAPALVIAQVRSLVRTLSQIRADAYWILEQVNTRLAEDLSDGRFATVALVFVATDGTIEACCAGHPLLVVRRVGDEPAVFAPGAPPLGMIAGFSADPPTPLVIEPGGRLVLLSDGLYESRNPEGEILGIERIAAAIGEAGASPADVVTRIRASAEAWRDGCDPEDDQAIVVLQRSRS